jgi:hypothetical protein
MHRHCTAIFEESYRQVLRPPGHASVHSCLFSGTSVWRADFRGSSAEVFHGDFCSNLLTWEEGEEGGNSRRLCSTLSQYSGLFYSMPFQLSLSLAP